MRHFTGTILITILVAIGYEGYSQNSFEELINSIPEYNLPIDPQTLLSNKSANLDVSVYNQYFTQYKDLDPYILLDDGEKAHADLAGVAEEDPIEYAPGKFDEIKIYPLGRVDLHPDFYSVIFAFTNMEYDNVYIYNFDQSGRICSGLALTTKDNLASTYRASLKYYSFIGSDKIIISHDFGEMSVLNMSFEVDDDGIFKMLNWQEDSSYYQDADWGINKKLAEINQFAAEGVPTLKNN